MPKNRLTVIYFDVYCPLSTEWEVIERGLGGCTRARGQGEGEFGACGGCPRAVSLRGPVAPSKATFRFSILARPTSSAASNSHNAAESCCYSILMHSLPLSDSETQNKWWYIILMTLWVKCNTLNEIHLYSYTKLIQSTMKRQGPAHLTIISQLR